MDNHNKGLMIKVHSLVDDKLGAEAARELGVCWNGIGEWLG